jgi:hypothetical protein
MKWESRKMDLLPYEAREKIDEQLRRTRYYVNLAGFENYCLTMFGKPYSVDYS